MDANMPKENIQRAITRGAGGADGSNYEEIRYEGYGIGGVAVVVDCMTDNRVRTVADVRHAFSKHGGNLGQEGSVAFLFNHCGQFIFAPGTSEDAVMEVALEAGADDVTTDEEGVIEVVCGISAYTAVRDALLARGLQAEMSDIVMKPQNEIELRGEEAIKMQKLLDALDNIDDVQEVYSNALMDEQA
jgi:YebC/PmpR family DNA-binding regulatory protein